MRSESGESSKSLGPLWASYNIPSPTQTPIRPESVLRSAFFIFQESSKIIHAHGHKAYAGNFPHPLVYKES
jgi:hypothetical protein